MLSAAEISNAIRKSLGDGRSLAIVSLLENGTRERLLVEEGSGPVAGTLGEKILDEIALRQAIKLIADDRQEIAVFGIGEIVDAAQKDSDLSFRSDLRLLFEISRPPLQLIICGGGHVGQAVAKAARLLDFNVTVIDDRTEFASRDKFPDPKIDLIAEDFIAGLKSLKITPASHLVIVTRGHRHDEICLRQVIDQPARYIGMIGSRRRTTTIRQRLLKEGIPPDLLHRVHSPIGLDIGAQTPEEIAFAIMAEIVLVRRGGTGLPKSSEGPMTKAR